MCVHFFALQWTLSLHIKAAWPLAIMRLDTLKHGQLISGRPHWLRSSLLWNDALYRKEEYPSASLSNANVWLHDHLVAASPALLPQDRVLQNWHKDEIIPFAQWSSGERDLKSYNNLLAPLSYFWPNHSRAKVQYMKKKRGKVINYLTFQL